MRLIRTNFPSKPHWWLGFIAFYTLRGRIITSYQFKLLPTWYIKSGYWK